METAQNRPFDVFYEKVVREVNIMEMEEAENVFFLEWTRLSGGSFNSLIFWPNNQNLSNILFSLHLKVPEWKEKLN